MRVKIEKETFFMMKYFDFALRIVIVTKTTEKPSIA